MLYGITARKGAASRSPVHRLGGGRVAWSGRGRQLNRYPGCISKGHLAYESMRPKGQSSRNEFGALFAFQLWITRRK
jgi:hypothetical protein